MSRDSSDGMESDGATLASGQEGGQNAAESPAVGKQDVNAEESLLDRFSSVMQEDNAGKSSNPDGSEDGSEEDGETDDKDPSKKEGEGEGQEGELGDVTDEELKGYKPSTAKRVKQLVRERNEARDRLKAVEPAVQGFTKIASFVKEAGLSKDEVNQGFEIMRLMKQNPVQALEALRPYVEQLLVVTGSVLPADIQKRVEAGEMTEAAALELSKAMAQNQHLQTTSELSARKAESDRVARAAQEAGGAVTSWEQAWSQSDPDYARKQPYVMREIERLLLKGEVPSSPQAAREMCEKVKRQVEKELAAFMPKKETVKAVTGGTQPNNLPAPTTTLQAMEQALRRTAG